MIGVKIGTAILGVLFNIYGVLVGGVTGIIVAVLAFSVIYFLSMLLLSFQLFPVTPVTRETLFPR